MNSIGKWGLVAVAAILGGFVLLKHAERRIDEKPLPPMQEKIEIAPEASTQTATITTTVVPVVVPVEVVAPPTPREETSKERMKEQRLSIETDVCIQSFTEADMLEPSKDPIAENSPIKGYFLCQASLQEKPEICSKIEGLERGNPTTDPKVRRSVLCRMWSACGAYQKALTGGYADSAVDQCGTCIKAIHQAVADHGRKLPALDIAGACSKWKAAFAANDSGAICNAVGMPSDPTCAVFFVTGNVDCVAAGVDRDQQYCRAMSAVRRRDPGLCDTTACRALLGDTNACEEDKFIVAKDFCERRSTKLELMDYARTKPPKGK